ncbi:MAG: hypothetical protein O9274_05640 [Limnobacter sp.]|uniref:hypothetical protein n=1 Tax=Limnobacter sp. TaxID=2003368 RepID=UPI0022C50913|nr:hypothetical protein [Limnobacter sp.]MCZ8015161.1 hypothetical protein [Limnobacter sp.]
MESTKSRWLEKTCDKCGEPVFFMESWSTIPKFCTLCRLKKIENIPRLLRQCLQRKIQIKGNFKTSELQQFRAKRQEEHAIAKQALHLALHENSDLVEVCIANKDLRDLVFRLHKADLLEHKTTEKFEQPLPLHIGRFLQGGSPGLKKR